MPPSTATRKAGWRAMTDRGRAGWSVPATFPAGECRGRSAAARPPPAGRQRKDRPRGRGSAPAGRWSPWPVAARRWRRRPRRPAPAKWRGCGRRRGRRRRRRSGRTARTRHWPPAGRCRRRTDRTGRGRWRTPRPGRRRSPRAVPTMKPARRPIRRISSEAGMVAERVPRTMVDTGSVASAGPASDGADQAAEDEQQALTGAQQRLAQGQDSRRCGDGARLSRIRPRRKDRGRRTIPAAPIHG